MKYLVRADVSGTYRTTVDAESKLDAISKASKELENSTNGKMSCLFVIADTWEQKESEASND
jgi:hypothetical protein